MRATDSRNIRPAAVAGRFYPSDPVALRKLITSLMSSVPAASGPAPKALIVPHAGYPYSGPIAASGYAQLVPERDVIKRIVLIGPAHYVELDGLAASSAEFFATPLGLVPVDTGAIRALGSLPQVRVVDEAHAEEHSLEVQLPFLQMVLADFSLVPLGVGETSPEAISNVLETLWGGPETRFVISSDLSHYHDSETARCIDQATAQAIEALRPEDIGDDQACGRLPIRGLLQTARARGLRARAIDLRNSGDTAGPRDRVVGYGAFALG
jgi:AmmeMemoRadiSam system protein B